MNATSRPGWSVVGGASRLVLASTSPRRRAMLAERGVRFEAADPGFDDSDLTPGETPKAGVLGGAEAWSASLAYLKARAVRRHLGERGVDAAVLGADTIVVHRGRLIGKPSDESAARAMLLAMMGDAHSVVTGCAVVGPGGERWVFADRAIVRLGALGPTVLEDYVASGRWRGKAGGYNLGEQVQAGWPIAFEGDPATVMGLPMRRLEGMLSAFVPGGGA